MSDFWDNGSLRGEVGEVLTASYLKKNLGFICEQPLDGYLKRLERAGIYDDIVVDFSKNLQDISENIKYFLGSWRDFWSPFMRIYKSKIHFSIDLMAVDEATKKRSSVVEVKTTKVGNQPPLHNYHSILKALDWGWSAYVSHIVFDQENSTATIAIYKVNAVYLTEDAYSFVRRKNSPNLHVTDASYIRQLFFRGSASRFGFSVTELHKDNFSIKVQDDTLQVSFKDRIISISLKELSLKGQVEIGEKVSEKMIRLYGYDRLQKELK